MGLSRRVVRLGDSEVVITCDYPFFAGVSARVERIDVVVEETAEQLGWGRVEPWGDAAVLAAPPPGSRPIPRRFVVFVCRRCGAWNLGPDEIVHLCTWCEGRSDLSHIDAVTTQAVKRETL